MSIDALIQAHIEALNTNTKAVELLTLSLAGRTPKAEDKPAKLRGTTAEEAAVDEIPGKKSRNAVVEDKKTDPKDPVEAADANNENNAKHPDDLATAVPYETVRALVLKLAPTQRDAIKALNAKYGIANLKVLLDKEDDFSTVNDQTKLEAVYADLQALEA